MDLVEVALCGHMFLPIGRNQTSMNVIYGAITRMVEWTSVADWWYIVRPKHKEV
ncbi:hypothetical protein BDFB_007546 [Asbolus verrucosus]|uniref:Uncharacterized protein n=1 Tax=Asbolus verrucosus TaxID=1661398 RepID=A0A482VS91_ASBVE|nr:hypothetical protein BDFB_007546 [Asbolus verrucosus]